MFQQGTGGGEACVASGQVCRVNLAVVGNIKSVLTHRLLRTLKRTRTIFARGRRLLKEVPNVNDGVTTRVGHPRVLRQTRGRLTFVRGGGVSYCCLASASCPIHLERYPSTPVLFCFGKGAGLSTAHVVDVINAHGTARCNQRLARSLVGSLTGIVPSLLIIDKLTCNVSVYTRQGTLCGQLPAITILTRNLSHVCPSYRQGATIRVLRSNNLLASFPDNARPSHPGFLQEGQVITKVSSYAVIIRSTRGKNSLMATSVTFSCNQSICDFPKHINSDRSGKYGGLVQRGGTNLVASTSSLLSTLY